MSISGAEGVWVVWCACDGGWWEHSWRALCVCVGNGERSLPSVSISVVGGVGVLWCAYGM